MSGRMMFGWEIPAQPTGHLNSQKGNGWRAQNNMWENIRREKCTVAVLRPDTLEKLRCTISSAILFCQVMQDLILRLMQKKKSHKGPCTSRIFCYCPELRFFSFSQKVDCSILSPLAALLLHLNIWKPLWGRAGTNNHKRRTDLARKSVGDIRWDALLLT